MTERSRASRQALLRNNAARQAAALEKLADAARRLEAVDTTFTKTALRKAVDAARDVGIGWTKIGDTLGIASGNAYQRYRKRPSPSSSCQQSRTA